MIDNQGDASRFAAQNQSIALLDHNRTFTLITSSKLPPPLTLLLAPFILLVDSYSLNRFVMLVKRLAVASRHSYQIPSPFTSSSLSHRPSCFCCFGSCESEKLSHNDFHLLWDANDQNSSFCSLLIVLSLSLSLLYTLLVCSEFARHNFWYFKSP
jgi:hypothetical protein